MLRIVASATEENETDSSMSTCLQPPITSGATTAAAALSQLEFLRNKLQDLEEENLALRSEVRMNNGKQKGQIRLGDSHSVIALKTHLIRSPHCRQTSVKMIKYNEHLRRHAN